MKYITQGILKWYDLHLNQPFRIVEENLQLAENASIDPDYILLRFTENYIQYYNEDMEDWLLYTIDSNDLFELEIIEKSAITTDTTWTF